MTDEELELQHRAAKTAEAVEHKEHLDSPSLVAPPWFSNTRTVTPFTPPVIPASPTAQDIVDALVSLGFATQAET